MIRAIERQVMKRCVTLSGAGKEGERTTGRGKMESYSMSKKSSQITSATPMDHVINHCFPVWLRRESALM